MLDSGGVDCMYQLQILDKERPDIMLRLTRKNGSFRSGFCPEFEEVSWVHTGYGKNSKMPTAFTLN
jgi:hypothetical protein